MALATYWRGGRFLDGVAAGLVCLLLTLLVLSPAHAARAAEPFAAWLAALRREAGGRGIAPATLDRTLTGLQPLARVLELDRHQPEFSLTLSAYLSRILTPERIRRGQRLWHLHRPLFDAVAAEHGVAPAVLVALWGIESDYGRVQGDFPLFGALATLAWDQRRAAFFRGELLAALGLADRGLLPADARSSWAGAYGPLQFLPSVLAAHGTDGDNDGRVQVTVSLADLFATASVFLRANGWQPGQWWGTPAHLDPDRPPPADHRYRSLADWHRLGVQPAGGAPPLPLPARLRLIQPNGEEAFLVGVNYDALLGWNRADSFALAVGLLAGALAAP